MKRLIIEVFIFLALLVVAAHMHTPQAAPPENFQTSQLIVTGLASPSGIGLAPDGRLFILERTGKVHIYKNNALLAQPFIELPSAASGDRGLTGITFDPDFATNKFVYFYYTGTDLINRLVRFRADTDTATDMTLLYQTSSPSFELHIGGTIKFGNDGKLYISIGDNGVSTNAQNLANPHGKILRINKDGSIPSDNPFVGQQGVLPEIWAYGFRNPFRFTIDPQTSRLYVGDVGDATWEEVNLVEKGKNYGWPLCEGICNQENLVDPIYTYPHNDMSSAVVVGPLYRGDMFPPQYQGRLFIGDYARGFIKTLSLDQQGHLDQVVDFDLAAGSVVDFQQGPDGSLYYVTYIPGRVYKVTYSQDSSIPVAVASADVTKGVEPLTVNFSSAGSYDPDGQTISFLWDFGDGTTSTAAHPTKIYAQKGTYTVELKVSDGQNEGISNPLTIQVGIPPTVNIGSPEDGSTYKAGDTIFYTASAIDAAGFDLHDGDFTTEVVFHHHDHIHPFLGPIVGKTGEFTIPKVGEPDTDQWYEIKITASDSNGLQTTKSVNIYPEVVNITLNTEPVGFNVLLNGAPTLTQTTISSVKNYEHILSVPLLQRLNGVDYQFHHWSTNQSTAHTYVTPHTDSNVTAYYQPVASFQGEYYDNHELGGTPIFTRTDQQIKFNWGFGSLDVRLSNDNFSVRWTKMQYFSEGRYIFSTITDDGARLFIDDELVLSEWHNQSPTRHNKIVYLSAGIHKIVMEYFEDGGGAMAEFEYTLALDQTPAAPSGWKAEYWNRTAQFPQIPSTQPDYQTITPRVYNNFGSGSPSALIQNDYFTARFTKEITFEEADYRFSVVADDGVRISVGGNVILDKWVDQPPTHYQMNQSMSEGPQEVVIEYYEKTGGSVVEFSLEKIIINEPPDPGSNGLAAIYYNNDDFSGDSMSRTDANINFDWGYNSPSSSIAPDTFSARWSGKITPIESGNYRFSILADDGIRLWVNGQKMIDQWVDQAPTEISSAFIHLEGETSYDFILEYYERGGGAVVRAFWQPEGGTKRIIESQFFTPDAVTIPQEQFLAEYWNTNSFTNIPTRVADLTASSPQAYFNWGDGTPGAPITSDNFMARFSGAFSFTGGNYEFKVVADDGVRIYIDNQLILDQWKDQAPTEYKITHPLSAGEHDIRIEYYEKTGGAVMEFSYLKI